MASILLIEPQLSMREQLESHIKSFGHEVMTVPTGREALHLLNGHHYDVIISDLHLRDVDGVKLLSEIRRAELKVPVLMFLAHPDKSLVSQALQFKLVDFLERPCRAEVLKASLDNAVEVSRLAKNLDDTLTSLCRSIGLPQSRIREILNLQTKSLSPLIESRMPLKKAA